MNVEVASEETDVEGGPLTCRPAAGDCLLPVSRRGRNGGPLVDVGGRVLDLQNALGLPAICENS